jgi:hypothetical protein
LKGVTVVRITVRITVRIRLLWIAQTAIGILDNDYGLL